MTEAFFSTVIAAGLVFIGACAGWAFAERPKMTCRPLMTVSADLEAR